MQDQPRRPIRKQSSKRYHMDIQNPPKKLIHKYQSKRSFGTNITNGQSKHNPFSKKKSLIQESENIELEIPQQKTNMITSTLMEQEITVAKVSPLEQTKDYENQIAEYLAERETHQIKFEDFLSWHLNVDADMRAILVGWIIDVHSNFKLKNQTLFIAIHLIDTYLSRQSIKRNYLQLLGITSLFISCKYQEIYVPGLARFVKVCDNAYDSAQILQMESLILLSLDFDLGYVSPFNFVSQKAQMLSLNPDVVELCKQLLDSALIQYKMCRYKSSLLGLTAIYLSNKILNDKKGNSKQLIQRYGVNQVEFKNCLKDLKDTYKQKEQQKFLAIKRKYASNT